MIKMIKAEYQKWLQSEAAKFYEEISDYIDIFSPILYDDVRNATLMAALFVMNIKLNYIAKSEPCKEETTKQDKKDSMLYKIICDHIKKFFSRYEGDTENTFYWKACFADVVKEIEDSGGFVERLLPDEFSIYANPNVDGSYNVLKDAIKDTLSDMSHGE